MESLVKKFLDSHGHLRPSTLKGYEKFLNRYMTFLNGQSPSKENAIAFLNQFNHIQTASLNRYRARMRKFMDWYGIDPSFIKFAKEKKKTISKKELLTKEELDLLLKNLQPHQQTIVMVILEGKLRVSECINLKVGDFQNCETHFNLHVKVSKTGQRTVPLVESVPYILNHLNSHPFKYDHEFEKKHFFIHRWGGKWSPYTRGGIEQILIDKRKLLGKHIYPHLLRHTGLTQAAKYLSDSQLKQLAGWTTRSMIDRYVHLASDDLENSVLAAYNIEPKEREDPVRIIENLDCPRCKFTNPGINKFCSNCGSALEADILYKYRKIIDKYKEKKEDLLMLFEEFIDKEFKEGP